MRIEGQPGDARTRAQTHRTSPRSSNVRIEGQPGDTAGVGFNPFRKHRRSASDYVMVASALIVCGLLVLWAIRG
ncbi:MAG: hypothetical protein N2037_00210 [Acidimicrobiales bacterium]|nr:hypothetical protein [Acidimicrobiales bacterium]